MMFELGRAYEIHFLQDSNEGPIEACSICKVVAWAAPLLQVKDPHGDTVFNTHSPRFIRAERVHDAEGSPAAF